jgi:hypothetical protein
LRSDKGAEVEGRLSLKEVEGRFCTGEVPSSAMIKLQKLKSDWVQKRL